MMDEKYIVFKREEFEAMMHPQAMNYVTAEQFLERLQKLALADAVVIRRQDLFAGPALHAYASSIAIASRLSDETKLQSIADYFHEQAVAADAEGWKLPD